jgi:predicted TIM-barrel fold metal-dependent hydrolase
MIVDCHQHLVPDIISTENLITQMDKTGIDKIALMASPCGPIPEPSPFLISAMRYSLTRSWLRPLSKKSITRFTEEGDVQLPTSVIKILKNPDNPLIFETAERYPDRFLAWCMVNPFGNKAPLPEYDRWKNHPACIGVKAHPFWHRYPLKKLLSVAERLVEKNAPLIVHLGFGENGDILSFANELPELKIILAHAGFPCYSDTWKIIKNRKNIVVDLSATAYVDEKIMADVSSWLGIERCLFGTDGPFGSHNDHIGFDMGLIKRRIEKVFPDKGHQRMILGENFMNITNLNK